MEERKPLRVLLVDDETHIRMLMKRLMKSLNLDVVAEAVNGADAVDMFRRHRPDITFLDVNMPLKNGKEALREIMSEFKDAVVVMLTSVSDRSDVEEILTLGATNYILKDTPTEGIKDRIRDTVKFYMSIKR